MNSTNLLEKLAAVSPGMEIWWDSSPAILANWYKNVLAKDIALYLEAVTTFVLMITIMGVAVDKRGSFSIVAGLPIGLAITGDIFFAGPVTGAAMNPAP